MDYEIYEIPGLEPGIFLTFMIYEQILFHLKGLAF